jgi:hypothetical protein
MTTMTGNPAGQPCGGAQTLLPARSAAEAHLYLDLHPCECGTARPCSTQELREDGNGGLMSIHAGTCPGCGRPWSAAFTLPAAPPDAGLFGGSEPSAIIDPGEWLWLSDQDADIPAGGPPGPQARARLERAAAAAEEAAKFIPEGHDRVPADAFTSSLGRVMRDAFPGRFAKADLSDRVQLYRAGARPGRERR